jgi:predicted Zn-dependent protease with MMP-like domain
VRRDRHGRGLRGPLAPSGVPIVSSPADRFDRIASEAVAHVERHWREQLADVEFAVDLVPAVEDEDAVQDEIESAGVPLARIFPAAGETPAHIVLYRKPIELRARDVVDLEELVHDVVVQIVADFLGLDPDIVDPGFGGENDPP